MYNHGPALGRRAYEHGIYVGDILTSLIATCRLAGVNPLGYLSNLMENRSAVFADPAAWLPVGIALPR